MTYLYQFVGSEETIEVSQRITEPALTHVEGREVRRLIAGTPRFALIDGPSGSWSQHGYSKPEHARQAEQVLGRKLHKPQ